jgi:SAM-dependent methyltransferase
MCGETMAIGKVGPLPDSPCFAGRELVETLRGGNLYRCDSCQSMQRAPIYTDAFYARLYEGGAAETWSNQKGRNDNRLISQYISEQPVISSVLDVGCNTGELLAMLPASIQKFGVEPSREAKAVAEGRGIKILADGVSSLDSDFVCDCVIAVDVIEHVPRPQEFVASLLKHVKPGGCLIVSTGNPGAVAWRNWFKSSFWYCSFPEHVSFPSQAAYERMGAHSGVEKCEFLNFCYSDNSISRKMGQMLLQTSFTINLALHAFVLKVLFAGLMRLGGGFHRRFFLPCAGLFMDHHICIMTKREAQ